MTYLPQEAVSMSEAKKPALAAKMSAFLWFIWGLVHILAGVMTISAVVSHEYGHGFANIADKVEPVVLTEPSYHDAVGAVLGQHGFNLGWIGVVTTVCALLIWNSQNETAMLFAGITGGLADLGYFIFLDHGGFVHFMPGGLMTYVSASAILLSVLHAFQNSGEDGSKMKKG